MKRAAVLVLTLCAACASPCGQPEPARIVHVDNEERMGDRDGGTVVEFKDGRRFYRAGVFGRVGDELNACRCQRDGHEWWQ